MSDAGCNGRYVIFELSSDDPAAALWATSQVGGASPAVPSVTTQGAAINYVAFEKGTTLPVGSSDSGGSIEHMGT